MPSRFFVQSAVVLFERAPALDAVVSALDGFEVDRTREPRSPRSWVGGHPEAILAYRRDLNGFVIADSIDSPWPDAMGDPVTDPGLFGAWTLGAFGPLVFPGALERAVFHRRRSRPDDGRAAALHGGLLRLRLSYALGAEGEASLWPEGADPFDEVLWIARLAMAVLQVPGALAFFNPNGEILLNGETLGEVLEGPDPPIEAFSAGRHGEISHAPGWWISDTVGMGQLGLPDLEATYPAGLVSRPGIDPWLRDARVDLIRGGSAEAPPGPRSSWRSLGPFEESLLAPPRPTLRFSAVAAPEPA